MQDLRYPIGKYNPPGEISKNNLENWIQNIESLPEKLNEVVMPLNEKQLEKLHRPEGWTVRQIVHHLADSHVNSYVRFKFALTEDNPEIKGYDEVAWADLGDSKEGPVSLSLNFIDALHQRWVYLLKTMKDSDWDRTFYHGEMKKDIDLKWTLGLYAWHGEHHLAHIRQALENNY